MRPVVLLLALAACGPSRGDDDDDTPLLDARGIDGPADAAPGDTSSELPSRVYAHTGKTLYRIETATLVETRVGDFTNLGTSSMTDIAVDRDERMVGITMTKIYEVDPATAAATELATFGAVRGFTSLSFVPADPANPDGPEILIAANDGGLVYRIDVDMVAHTATATQIGAYGMQGGTAIGSSGDIVSVRGFGTVATVNVGTGRDYLARLDPTMGWKATVVGTGTGFDNIFGLGFWAGKLYGFVDDGATAMTGAFVEINPTTGAATLVRAGNLRWFGAGVTTVAPLIP